MALTREIGYLWQAVEQRELNTSAATSAGSAPNINVDSSDAACGISGRIIDRLNVDFGSRLYRTAELSGYLWATRGSTEANRRLDLAVKLEHGDSSGGGDMAAYSTGTASTGFVLFTSAQTTPMHSWSTAPIYAQTPPNFYDLSAAKQFIRAVLTAKKYHATTESSGDEHAHIGAIVRFGGGDELAHRFYSSAPASTSTSTST